MITYLLLCGTALLAALLYLKCLDHAETRRELVVERQERQQREREIDAARTGIYSLEQLEMERL